MMLHSKLFWKIYPTICRYLMFQEIKLRRKV